MDSTLFETEFYTASQCLECDVPGYIILESKTVSGKLYKLKIAAQIELGILLSNIERSVDEVLEPENIYLCKFGEEGTILHFHLFPRTKDITSRFLENFPGQEKLIHGPVLFDWARDY